MTEEWGWLQASVSPHLLFVLSWLVLSLFFWAAVEMLRKETHLRGLIWQEELFLFILWQMLHSLLIYYCQTERKEFMGNNCLSLKNRMKQSLKYSMSSFNCRSTGIPDCTFVLDFSTDFQTQILLNGFEFVSSFCVMYGILYRKWIKVRMNCIHNTLYLYNVTCFRVEQDIQCK